MAARGPQTGMPYALKRTMPEAADGAEDAEYQVTQRVCTERAVARASEQQQLACRADGAVLP